MAQLMDTLEISCHVETPLPLRLLVEQHVTQYHIQAFPACRPTNTVVYVGTRSSAIAAHVLGSDWRTLLADTFVAKYRGTGDNWSEEDEQKLAMRIIQAGGTVLDTTEPMNTPFDVQRTRQFAAFSRTKKYILVGHLKGVSGYYISTVWYLGSIGSLPSYPSTQIIPRFSL